jgi:hypothetical protein
MRVKKSLNIITRDDEQAFLSLEEENYSTIAAYTRKGILVNV